MRGGTTPSLRAAGVPRVYPRLRGGTKQENADKSMEWGLSPLARGNLPNKRKA